MHTTFKAAIAGALLALTACGANPQTTAVLPSTYTPYCTVNTEVSLYLTVSGPANGVITVDGVEHGWLIEADEDVADEAAPYDGILYNVPGPGEVRVNDIACETVGAI